MADDIVQWLGELGLGQHAQTFAENGIGLDVVARLSDDDLKELGLNLGESPQGSVRSRNPRRCRADRNSCHGTIPRRLPPKPNGVSSR